MPRPLLHRAGQTAARGMGLVFVFAHGWVEAQTPPAAAAFAIDHAPPACVAAEKYAGLSACFRQHGSLARGRVYFRPEGTEDWFYVEMTGEPPCLLAVLPRPRKDLGAIEYYISGLDRELDEVQTAEYTIQVTQSSTCSAGPMAPIVESDGVIIGSASGETPAGFLTGDGVPVWAVAGMAAGATLVVAVIATRGGGEARDPPPANVIPVDRGLAAGHGTRIASELRVPGGQGHLVVDGGQVFPTSDGITQAWPLRPGLHHVEAVLLEGQGHPGLWQFELEAFNGASGIHAVTGDVAALRPDRVVFRFAGRPGERAAFTVRIEE